LLCVWRLAWDSKLEIAHAGVVSILRLSANCKLTITPEDAGEEVRSLSREERPAIDPEGMGKRADLLELVHPILAKKGIQATTRSIA